MAFALWSPDVPPLLAWELGVPWNGSDAVLAVMRGQRGGPLTGVMQSPPAEAQPLASGGFRPLFDIDFYNRLHLSIANLALGNVVGEQSRIVSVWNAYSYGVTLQSMILANGEGIEVSGQPPAPLGFVSLQERSWVVRVEPEGPPTIDATVSWSFDVGTTLVLHITGNRVSPWTWRPDWARGITEALEWRTDVLEAEEGDEQRQARRLTPRQSWAFTSTAINIERQAMEAALAGWGARVWALPLWPHGADLLELAPAGSTQVVTRSPAGREFIAGGLALLIGDDSFNTEVVEILEVGADRLTLKRELAKEWPVGTTVYPAKSARITDSLVSRFTGSCSDVSVTFTVSAANPYPMMDVATLPQHRGYGVLEDRPDWSQAPALVPERRLTVLDNGAGVPLSVDRSGYPTMRQTLRYGPVGRAQLDRIRRIQYHLAGRLRALWVPSYANDLRLDAVAIPGASNIDVAYCGYTAYLRGLVGRSDIRIESAAGIQYRQITGSTDLNNGMERLSLAEPITNLLDPGAETITISYLSLARGDSDRLEWAWWSGDMGADSAHADTTMPMRTFRNEF